MALVTGVKATVVALLPLKVTTEVSGSVPVMATVATVSSATLSLPKARVILVADRNGDGLGADRGNAVAANIHGKLAGIVGDGNVVGQGVDGDSSLIEHGTNNILNSDLDGLRLGSGVGIDYLALVSVDSSGRTGVGTVLFPRVEVVATADVTLVPTAMSLRAAALVK